MSGKAAKILLLLCFLLVLSERAQDVECYPAKHKSKQNGPPASTKIPKSKSKGNSRLRNVGLQVSALGRRWRTDIICISSRIVIVIVIAHKIKWTLNIIWVDSTRFNYDIEGKIIRNKKDIIQNERGIRWNMDTSMEYFSDSIVTNLISDKYSFMDFMYFQHFLVCVIKRWNGDDAKTVQKMVIMTKW